MGNFSVVINSVLTDFEVNQKYNVLEKSLWFYLTWFSWFTYEE